MDLYIINTSNITYYLLQVPKVLSKPSCEDGERDGGVAADAMEKEEFHRDPMTEVIGAVGPFQIVWHVVLGLSIVIHAWQMFANKWLTYKVREVHHSHIRLMFHRIMVRSAYWFNFC